MYLTPTAIRLHQLLIYDPDSGELTARVSRPRVTAGMVVGTLNRHGIRKVGIDGKIYTAANLVWVMQTGEAIERPARVVICNGQLDDLRWSNLRLARDGKYKEGGETLW